MTLCVAATCLEDGQPRIILASDLRVEKDWIGAEVTFKLSWLTKGWAALFAGSVASAREVIQSYTNALDGTKLNESNVHDELKRPAEGHKLALCEHHVRMKLGMAYSEFLQSGRIYLSEAMFQETESEIRKLNLNCDLITCGFPSRTPCMLTIAADGEVCRHDNFATIGTGSVIAESVLYQRRLTHRQPLERAMYIVYEATKLASIAPGVGQHFSFVVVGPTDDEGYLEARSFTLDGYRHHEELFKKYAPKKLDELPAMSTEYLSSVVKLD